MNFPWRAELPKRQKLASIPFLTFVTRGLNLLSFSTHSQGSNNSDQSSGYLSGSGGSNSLPPNANPVDAQNPYGCKYGSTRLDHLGDKFHASQGQHQPKNLKKLSLTSSLNDYSSSTTNEAEIEYSNNIHKWVHLRNIFQVPELFRCS